MPLIRETISCGLYDVEIVATGMHLLRRYGYTLNEIYKSGFDNVFPIFNQDASTSEKMDIVLANTIVQLSHYVNEKSPDLLVAHGDRVETLASAIVCSLNNIYLAHVEGGELSGHVDGTMRHSISKLAQVHLVANEDAKSRLVQMGECDDSIHVIGSPEVDIMLGGHLPEFDYVQERYDVPFGPREYAIFVYHPVHSEINASRQKSRKC